MKLLLTSAGITNDSIRKFYLSYWMQQSGLVEQLPRLLQEKVYVGRERWECAGDETH